MCNPVFKIPESGPSLADLFFPRPIIGALVQKLVAKFWDKEILEFATER